MALQNKKKSKSDKKPTKLKTCVPFKPKQVNGKADKNIAKIQPNSKKVVGNRKKDDYDIRGNKPKRMKYTDDGYKIYSIEELNIKSNPVMTDKCPFDCDCHY